MLNTAFYGIRFKTGKGMGFLGLSRAFGAG